MKRLFFLLFCVLIGVFVFYTLQVAQANWTSEPKSSLFGKTTETEVAPEPEATPIVCTSLPEGMNLKVTALTSKEVLVHISGLQVGEFVTIIYERDLQDWQRLKGRLIFHSSQPIGVEGYFDDKGTGLSPLAGVSPNRWQVQVVHARGVACQTITLPENEVNK